jgi:hypothetical protein
MEKKTIYKKLLEAQKEIGAIKKDSENPYYKSKYFDINSLLATVKPILNKHGLVLLQALDDGKLNTVIADAEAGLTIGYSTPLPAVSDVQKLGSAITYMRRYALQSMLALEAEDDDANSTKLKPITKEETNEDPF